MAFQLIPNFSNIDSFPNDTSGCEVYGLFSEAENGLVRPNSVFVPSDAVHVLDVKYGENLGDPEPQLDLCTGCRGAGYRCSNGGAAADS